MNAEADATTPTKPAAPAAPSVAESWTAMAAWAADELGCRLRFDGSVYQIEPQPDERANEREASESGIRRSWWRRRAAPDAGAAEELAPAYTAEHPADVVAELIERLSQRAGPAHARPVNQPEAVHELSARLFEAYRLDGGQAHLAGFHLEDTPLVRLTWVGEADDEKPLVRHAFYDELGRPLGVDLAKALGVDRLAPMADATPRLEVGRRDRMLESARRAGEETPALATIVWAKRASGRVRFEFGEESVDTRFDGWASLLTPPPVVCPSTGVETFHLATVDGGAVAAAEQIAECSVSGHRRVLGDLGRCSTTGRLAEPEWLAECPITGETVLRTELQTCRLCDQRVSPAANPEGVCRACRSKQRVGSGDERVARLVQAHPGLRAWAHWRVAETRDVVVAEASRRLKCVQWVFDRESLEPIHAVATTRFLSTWRPLSRDQRERLLR